MFCNGGHIFLVEGNRIVGYALVCQLSVVSMSHVSPFPMFRIFKISTFS